MVLLPLYIEKIPAGKEALLLKEKQPSILFKTSGCIPARKGAVMDNFNLALFLIFLILYILKNGSHRK